VTAILGHNLKGDFGLDPDLKVGNLLTLEGGTFWMAFPPARLRP